MKKKIVILGIVLAVIVIGVAVLATPMAFFRNVESMEIYRVEYVGSDEQHVNITDEVDLESLESCLPLIRCRRFRTQFAPYLLRDVEYEISLIDYGNNRFVNIILGEDDLNYVYISADEGGYQIVNKDAWMTVMDLLQAE